ncbi:MAG: dUTP diphosphatase [Patescibacteria group bacterium]|nr:dUTP diphosphatase [Patescibacteria group bacterium]
MKITIKRVDKSLPLPKYETSGAVAFDFLCREGALVKPKEIKLIPANVIIKIPSGYMLLLASRSSTSMKKGLMLINGIGVIDQDYCGSEDEIRVQVYNFTDQEVRVEKGDRLAQGIFVKIERGEWREVEKTQNHSRGGFGSTG